MAETPTAVCCKIPLDESYWELVEAEKKVQAAIELRNDLQTQIDQDPSNNTNESKKIVEELNLQIKQLEI